MSKDSQVIYIATIVGLLCFIGVLLWDNVKLRNSHTTESYVSEKPTPIDPVFNDKETLEDSYATSTSNTVGDIIPLESSIDDRYVQHSSCRDYDTAAPYYTKTFLAGYTRVDKTPVADVCVDMGLESSLLLEYSCVENDISEEEYVCPFGCVNGACLLESQAQQYAKQETLPDISWVEGGVEMSVSNVYIGDVIAPFGTVGPDGKLIPVGELVHGILVSLSMETLDAEVCISPTLERVVDESGKKVLSNTSSFQFMYNGGCLVPAFSKVYHDVLFIDDGEDGTYLIYTGEVSGITFIITTDTSGNVIIDQSVPLG